MILLLSKKCSKITEAFFKLSRQMPRLRVAALLLLIFVRKSGFLRDMNIINQGYMDKIMNGNRMAFLCLFYD